MANDESRQDKSPPLPTPDKSEARHWVGLGYLTLLIFAFALAMWVWLAPLSGAVIAQGIVKVDLNRKTIQHQEGGIVQQIRVRNGDRVQAGDILIILADARIEAELALTQKQIDAERARFARLASEASLAPRPAFPPELLSRTKESIIADVLEKERSLFQARRIALTTQTDLLRKQIQQTGEEALALTRQIAAEERALALQHDELRANRELLEKNYVQKTRVLTLDRMVADYEARIGEHKAELAKARQRDSELELRIASLANSYIQTATDTLRESNARLLELDERIKPLRDAMNRQMIVAPQAGEVVDLKVTTIGAAIGPREPLMDIVPTDGRLILEGRIRPEDINYVSVGNKVDISLTAYKQRTTPIIEGRVIYVSADRLIDRLTNNAYYEFHADVSEESLAQVGNLKLQAGMPAELFVNTGARTVLDYLTEPLTAYLRRALREP